jgi:multiple sugar transport system permease protein
MRGARAGGPARDARPRRRGPRRRQAVAWAFLGPAVLHLAVCYAYPLYRNIELSLHDYTLRAFVYGGARFSGLENYRTVLHDPTFGRALENTVLFTFCSLAVQYAVGLALAVFFHQDFPLSTTLRALFLVPWLLPLIVSASTWAWMFDSTSGVLDYALHRVGVGPVDWLTSPTWALVSVTVANIWVGIPFNLVLLHSGLQDIPQVLYEAAALDGANAWQRFRHVTFPLLRPVSAITLTLGLIYTLKVFDIIWIMTRGGPVDASTTLSVWSYRFAFGSPLPRFGPGAAVGNILMLIALVFGAGYLWLRSRVQRR